MLESIVGRDFLPRGSGNVDAKMLDLVLGFCFLGKTVKGSPQVWAILQ